MNQRAVLNLNYGKIVENLQQLLEVQSKCMKITLGNIFLLIDIKNA